MLRTVKLQVTTAADGSGTAVSKAILGKLLSIDYDKGSFATGVDLTLAVTNSDAAYTLITLTDANTSTTYHPRGDSCGQTGTVNTGGYDVKLPIVGKLTLTVAAGGDTKTGSVVVIYEDD